MPATPTSPALLMQLAQQMANNPADAVALGTQMTALIRDLPPDRMTLISRPNFERATLWTYGVSFENVEVASPSEAPPQIKKPPLSEKASRAPAQSPEESVVPVLQLWEEPSVPMLELWQEESASPEPRHEEPR